MGAVLCCHWLPWPFRGNNSTNSGSAASRRGDTRVAPDEGRVPIMSCTDSEQQDSMDTFCCPARPLPYDDPRFSHQTEQHSIVATNDKASTQFEKSSQLGEGKNADTRSTRAGKDDGSSKQHSSGGSDIGRAQIYACVDCEDDCPICLEEYNHENPKITLQCNHNYHLSCIFEWMERSQSCPICAKVMLFNEDE